MNNPGSNPANMINRPSFNPNNPSPSNGPGLVGSYPRMPGQQNQSSLLGMNAPGMLPVNRPVTQTNSNPMFNPRAQQNQGLMGNRPPLVGNNPGNGLMPIRPGLAPNMPQGPNGPGLLNNPTRMPMNTQRNDWDRSNNNNPIVNTFNNQNQNGLIAPNNNPLLMMNQNQRNNMNPNAPMQSYNYGMGGPNSAQNCLLGQPPNPFPNQTPQAQQASHFQHPGYNQAPTNPGQALIQPSHMSQQQMMMGNTGPMSMHQNPSQPQMANMLNQAHVGQDAFAYTRHHSMQQNSAPNSGQLLPQVLIRPVLV